MKHRGSVFAPKRLNYPTSGFIIPSQRPRFSHIYFQNYGVSANKGCLFTMRVDQSLLNTIEIRRLSRPKSSRNLSSDRLKTRYESCEK